MCAHVHACHGMNMKVIGQLVGVSSLHSPCGSQERTLLLSCLIDAKQCVWGNLPACNFAWPQVTVSTRKNVLHKRNTKCRSMEEFAVWGTEGLERHGNIGDGAFLTCGQEEEQSLHRVSQPSARSRFHYKKEGKSFVGVCGGSSEEKVG